MTYTNFIGQVQRLPTASQALDTVLPFDKPIEVGIGDFTALAIVNESFTLTSRVPTAHLEDGSFANDHIILDPVTISISGNVSDVFLQPTRQQLALRRARAKLGVVTAYLPGKTQAQIQRANALIEDVHSQIQRLDRIISDGKQIASFLGDQTGTKTLQQKFVDQVQEWHLGRSLLDIEMPYRTFSNMRIVSTRISRDNAFDALTFEIRAQEVRFAKTETVAIQQFSPSDSLKGQANKTAKKSPQKGEQSLISWGIGLVTGG